MPITEAPPLAVLFEQDETAWLEAMANLAADGRAAEMDFVNLSEYLADMAKRDRREVSSRLVTLLALLLKSLHQPDRRPGSWEKTILEQRRELRDMVESGTLRNHAVAILARCYADACKEAAAETGLPRSTFAPECPWDMESVLVDEGEPAEQEK